jgi:hypothetical protein
MCVKTPKLSMLRHKIEWCIKYTHRKQTSFLTEDHNSFINMHPCLGHMHLAGLKELVKAVRIYFQYLNI